MTSVALERARSPSRPPTVRLAALVAHAAGVRLADVLRGGWPGDLCPRCGRGGVPRGAGLAVSDPSPMTADDVSRGLAGEPPTAADVVAPGDRIAPDTAPGPEVSAWSAS
jgi:hypothetical protein